MRRALCYKIFAATLFAVIQIINSHPIEFNNQQDVSMDYISEPDMMEYDQFVNYDNNADDKIIKANIRDILEQNNLEVNLKKYKKSQQHHNSKKVSPDYLNDHPYAHLHLVYHDDIDEDLETDEHVKKLFHAIENNELLELYVECAKFARLKEQYYQKGGRNDKKRFNRQVFDEIENFCEFIKTDDDDFII